MKKTISLEQHKAQVERFIKENNYEPTAIDFDNTDYLPTARTIQRRYGGLPAFRKAIGLITSDITKGKARSKKAKKAMDKCLLEETKLFQELLVKYRSNRVSSPAKLFLNNLKTVDFKIEKDGKIYLIDVFYPNTRESFESCVNIKNKKYNTKEESFYTVPVEIILVCLNDKVVYEIKRPLKTISISEFRKTFLS